MKHSRILALTAAVLAPVVIAIGQQGKTPATPKTPAPAAKAAGKLAVESGPVTVKKKAAGKAKAAALKIVKGLTADIYTKETAVVGEEAKAVAKFGGCKITLMENTTFEVLEVGDDVSVVEILGVEMELERGTVMECEFGSLKVNLTTGSFKANPTPGVVTTLRIVTASGQTLNFTLQPGTQVNLARSPTGQLMVSVPPGSPNVTMSVTTTDAQGNTTTKTLPPFKSGTSTTTDQVAGGVNQFSATEQGPGQASSPSEIVDEGAKSAGQNQPPQGTVVGTLPLSTGLGQ